MAATVHIVPQQIRLISPLCCELSTGADTSGWTFRQTLTSSMASGATAGNSATAWFEFDAVWTGSLEDAHAQDAQRPALPRRMPAKRPARPPSVPGSMRRTTSRRSAVSFAMAPGMDLPKWEGQAITNIRQFGDRRSRREGQRHQQSHFPRGFSVFDPTSNIRAQCSHPLAARGQSARRRPGALMSSEVRLLGKE